MNRAFSYRHPRETWWKDGWLRAYQELGSQKTHERASLAFRRWMNCEKPNSDYPHQVSR